MERWPERTAPLRGSVAPEPTPPSQPDPVPDPSPFPPAPIPAPNPNPVPRPEPIRPPVPHVRTPGGRARKRWARGALALAGPLWLATAAFAQELPCASDALGETSCAKDERGSAVVDGLGRVVCAPGMCVQRQDEWLCSWLPGGDAGLSPEGPVCDGGCRHPSSDECESL